MAFNGSGVFERLYSWVTDRDNGTKILASRMDADTDGIVAGINSIVNGTQPFIAPVRASFGTAASPSHSFTDDPDTGMYRPAANELAFSEGGVDRGRFYGRKNILGTVSQAAGVPTGSIIERGSNANGDFARFADGTQICTRTITVNTAIATASGGVFTTSSTASATHAASFVAFPVVSVQMERPAATGFDIMAVLESANTTVTTFRFARIASDGTARDLTARIIAIGRWF